ncbi:MAG: TIM-barrel domain-containing protein, partial [Planctomycetota bacterium]
MFESRRWLTSSVLFMLALVCSGFSIGNTRDSNYSRLSTSFNENILLIRNSFFNLSLDVETGMLEFRDEDGRPVLKGTSDYSITNGEVVEGTYNYDLVSSGTISPEDYKEHTWTVHKTFSSKGEGRVFTIVHSGYSGYPDLIQKIKVDEEGTAIFIGISLSDRSGSVIDTLLISELRVLGIEMIKSDAHWFSPIEKNLFMMRQGTKSPSDRRLVVALENEKFPESYNHGSYNKTMRRETSTELKYLSESFTSLIHSKNQRTLFMGFVTQHRQATQIIARRKKDDQEYLEVSCRCDIEGNPYSERQILNSEILMLDFVSLPDSAKKAYVNEIKKRHGQPTKKEYGARWNTWEYYRKYITEDEVIRNMEAIKSLGLDVEYIHIDDGYQDVEDEWLGGNSRFPHGIKWLAEEIKKRGFKASIWINPFLTLTGSKLSKQHPEYMVKDRKGKLLKVGHHNLGFYEASGNPDRPLAHLIDYTVPGAREYLRNLMGTLVHEWGFTVIKLDGPWRGYYYESVPRGSLSNPA